MRKIGIVLLNMGGPNNEEAVQPFLYNLFMDDDIIKLPFQGGLRRGLVKMISSRRAKKVAEKYKEINACPKGCMGPKTCSNRQNKRVSDCCSATNPITEWQRRELEKQLNSHAVNEEYRVVTAMRYWHPFSDEAIDQLLDFDCEEVVLLPLYPQFSVSTTASSFNEWTRRIEARNLDGKWKTHMISSYQTHPTYIGSINDRIDEGLLNFPEEIRDEVQILFSAHGTPVSYMEDGDPYSFQIKESIKAVIDSREDNRPHWLSYQSRVGPVKWLQPNTEDFLSVLRGYGIKHLLVVPIAFVSDHIETSHEIGIEFKEVADELGFENFKLTEGLNDMPRFITTLEELVKEKLGMGELEEERVEG